MSDSVRDYGWLLQMEGEVAYRNGFRLGACPYDPNSETGLAWVEGWLEAFKQEYDRLDAQPPC
jgi:hypothetical protein